MKKYILLLLLFMTGLCYTQDTSGTVITISEIIGSQIDLAERSQYGFFMAEQNFESAVLYKRPDSSLAFKITLKKTGGPDVRVRWLPTSREEVDRVRNLIESKTGALNSTAPLDQSESGQLFRLPLQSGFSAGMMLAPQFNAWDVNQDAYLGILLDIKWIGLEYHASFLRSTPVLSLNLYVHPFSVLICRPFVTLGGGKCTKHKDEGFINVGYGAFFKLMTQFYGKIEYRYWGTFGEGETSLIQLGVQYYFMGKQHVKNGF